MVDYQHVVAVHADVSRRKKRNWIEVEDPPISKSLFSVSNVWIMKVNLKLLNNDIFVVVVKHSNEFLLFCVTVMFFAFVTWLVISCRGCMCLFRNPVSK